MQTHNETFRVNGLEITPNTVIAFDTKHGKEYYQFTGEFFGALARFRGINQSANGMKEIAPVDISQKLENDTAEHLGEQEPKFVGCDENTRVRRRSRWGVDALLEEHPATLEEAREEQNYYTPSTDTSETEFDLLNTDESETEGRPEETTRRSVPKISVE